MLLDHIRISVDSTQRNPLEPPVDRNERIDYPSETISLVGTVIRLPGDVPTVILTTKVRGMREHRVVGRYFQIDTC